MLRKELCILIAIIIAIVCPAVPSNHWGDAKDMENVDCGEKLKTKLIPYEYPRILQKAVENVQENCPKLLDRSIEYNKVASCVLRNIFFYELKKNNSAVRWNQRNLNSSYRGWNNYFINVCNNWGAIKACWYPYNVILNDCWSVGDKINSATDDLARFFCNSDGYRKKLARIFALPDSKICVDSYVEDTLNCISVNFELTKTDEFTLIPSHKDFCGSLIRSQYCASRRATKCDNSVLVDLATNTLSALSNAVGCSTMARKRSKIPQPQANGADCMHMTISRFLLLHGIFVAGVFKVIYG